MTRNKEHRVGIFIDVQNLYHSAKNLFQSRVNYKELVKEVTAGRKLIRVIGYVVKTETTEGEAAFFDALTKAGVELRVKDIQIFAGGAKKADWDVGMAVDAIRMADSFDAIVLVTGDGDFCPLVEYLKWGLGKTVEVAAFSRSTSSKLKEAADTFVTLDEFPGVILGAGRVRRTTARTSAKPAGMPMPASSEPQRGEPEAPTSPEDRETYGE